MDAIDAFIIAVAVALFIVALSGRPPPAIP
jgi:hypothetical protein